MFRANRAHHQERQIVSIQPLVAVTPCRWPCPVQVGSELPTCTGHDHRQLPEVVLTQFVSPDDEHDVLETCRELKIETCATRWSFTKNHYMMHGQQNKTNVMSISNHFSYISCKSIRFVLYQLKHYEIMSCKHNLKVI